VSARDEDGRLRSAEQELALFRASFPDLRDADLCVVGVAALSRRLEALLRVRVAVNLAPFRKRVAETEARISAELEAIGASERSAAHIFGDLRDRVKGAMDDSNVRCAQRVLERVQSSLDRSKVFKLAVAKAEVGEFFKTRFRYDRAPFFQGEEVFSEVRKRTLGEWVALTLESLPEICGDMAGALDKAVAARDSDVARDFAAAVRDCAREEAARFRDSVSCSVRDLGEHLSVDFMTMNHYVDAKAAAAKQMADLGILEGGAIGYAAVQAKVERMWTAEGMREQQGNRVLVAIEAAWAVDFKTFVDEVLRIVVHAYLGVAVAAAAWASDDKLVRLAGESPALKDHRDALLRRLDRVRRALHLLPAH
jgi:hypothetical protein